MDFAPQFPSFFPSADDFLVPTTSLTSPTFADFSAFDAAAAPTYLDNKVLLESVSDDTAFGSYNQFGGAAPFSGSAATSPMAALVPGSPYVMSSPAAAGSGVSTSSSSDYGSVDLESLPTFDLLAAAEPTARDDLMAEDDNNSANPAQADVAAMDVMNAVPTVVLATDQAMIDATTAPRPTGTWTRRVRVPAAPADAAAADPSAKPDKKTKASKAGAKSKGKKTKGKKTTSKKTSGRKRKASTKASRKVECEAFFEESPYIQSLLRQRPSHLTEAQRVERQKAKNRIAAKQSRQRKRDEVDSVKARLAGVEHRNAELEAQLSSLSSSNSALEAEVAYLRAVIAASPAIANTADVMAESTPVAKPMAGGMYVPTPGGQQAQVVGVPCTMPDCAECQRVDAAAKRQRIA